MRIVKNIIQAFLFITMLAVIFFAICGIGAVFPEGDMATIIALIAIGYICTASCFLFVEIDHAYLKTNSHVK